MVSMSSAGSTRPPTWTTSGSAKARITWQIASASRMFARNLLPSPSPSLAPLTMPAMSTNETVAGTTRALAKISGEPVEPLVGQRDDADVGLDRGERVVRRQHLGLRQRVEEGGLADVGQSDDADGECHGSRSLPAPIERSGRGQELLPELQRAEPPLRDRPDAVPDADQAAGDRAVGVGVAGRCGRRRPRRPRTTAGRPRRRRRAPASRARTRRHRRPAPSRPCSAACASPSARPYRTASTTAVACELARRALAGRHRVARARAREQRRGDLHVGTHATVHRGSSCVTAEISTASGMRRPRSATASAVGMQRISDPLPAAPSPAPASRGSPPRRYAAARPRSRRRRRAAATRARDPATGPRTSRACGRRRSGPRRRPARGMRAARHGSGRCRRWRARAASGRAAADDVAQPAG